MFKMKAPPQVSLITSSKAPTSYNKMSADLKDTYSPWKKLKKQLKP